jgi:parvulin-like peptidyl-prolyl isomerase
MKRSPLSTLLLLLAALSLTACGGSGDDSSENAAVNTPIGSFTVQVGEPIQDSTQAAIVQTAASTDTLQTQQFRQQLKKANKRMSMMQGNRPNVRRRIVEGFVGRNLMTQLNQQLVEMADSLNIQADTAQVNQRFRKIRGQFPSEQAYRKRLAQQNLTEDSLRSMLRQRARVQKLQQRTVKNVAQPTSSEVDSARRAAAEQIKLQHILLRVPRGASPEATDSVQQRAQTLIDSVQSDNADFAALARRHSDDPASAQKGGSMGWVSRDSSLVEPFQEAAFGLSKQQSITSEPVKTQFGYHVIRVTDRRTGEMMPPAKARQQIVQQRGQDAWRQTMDRQRKRIQATVRLNQDVVQTELSAPSQEEDTPAAS